MRSRPNEVDRCVVAVVPATADAAVNLVDAEGAELNRNERFAGIVEGAALVAVTWRVRRLGEVGEWRFGSRRFRYKFKYV